MLYLKIHSRHPLGDQEDRAAHEIPERARGPDNEMAMHIEIHDFTGHPVFSCDGMAFKEPVLDEGLSCRTEPFS